MTSNPLMNIDFADFEVRTLALLGGRSTGKSMLLNDMYKAAVDTGRSAMMVGNRSRMVNIDEWGSTFKDYPTSYLMQVCHGLSASARLPSPVRAHNLRYSEPKIDRVGLTLPDRKDDLHTYVQISDSATPSNQSCIAGALASLLRS